MKKVICLALVITSIFIIPVSADQLSIGEYGMGVVRSRTVDKEWTQNTRKILSYPFAEGVTNAATDTLYFFTQFGWLPDYTYTVTIEYRTKQRLDFTNLDFDFFTSDGYTINTNNPTYQNVKWNIENRFFYDSSDFPFIVTKSEESWLNPDDLYNNYYLIRYTIVFSNAIVGLEDMEYLLGRWNQRFLHDSVIEQPNMDVSAFYDPGGQIYEEVLVDLIEQIINAGSDHKESIPTNGGALSEAVTDLDNAEKDLYNKSDSLIENVQTQLDESKEQAVAALPNLTTTALAVTTVYNQIKATLPDEVKVLFVVIPVILFFAYLIGRKD